MSEEAFIYEAIRTPRGKQKNGALHEVKPLNLVTGLIESSLHLHRPHRLRHGRADRYLSTTQHPSLEA